MMRDYDAIVVGAGTAGCLAAKTVSEAGLKVCLIERKRRQEIGEKICGDALGEHHLKTCGLEKPQGGELDRRIEGIKIYSWGTLNQDMQVLAGLREDNVFWKRRIRAGERFSVWLECDCTLGPNLYEIQAAVSFESTPDYMSQRILHWKDEAAFFQALMRQDEYFFGGLCDLRMVARW